MQSANLQIVTPAPDGVSEKDLQAAFRATISQINWLPKGTVNLAFVSSAQIQKLNKQFAKNDYPTDVLSFPYQVQVDSFEQKEYKVIGEIVICSSIAKTQAKQFKVDLQDEVRLLLIHGLIHLSGEDHQTGPGQARFERSQSAIMNTLKANYHPMPWSA